MAAVGSPAIREISDTTGLTYSFVERATRPLIELDRFVHRGRKELRASDLKSLINAITGSQASDAVVNDNILSALEYKSTWPPNAKPSPALGDGNWGEVLERMIEHAAPWQDYTTEAANNDVEVNYLPHLIEICLEPPGIVLIWNGPDGAPKRKDFYGPERVSISQQSKMLVRKSFLHSNIINVAGDILRESPWNMKTEDAAPARAAPSYDNPTDHAAERSGTNKPDPTRAGVSVQPKKPTPKRSVNRDRTNKG